MDRLVLWLHHLAEHVEVGVLARVVLVGLEERDDAGRRRVHEALDSAGRLQRRGHVGEVLPERRLVLDTDLADTRRALHLRRLAHGGDALHVGREHLHVPRHLARAVAREAVQPLRDVGGVAALAHLAVGDDVDAGVHLPAHDVRHGAHHAGVEGALVGERLVLLGEQHVGDVLRPRQGAHVRGENAFGAELHAVLPPCASTRAGRTIHTRPRAQGARCASRRAPAWNPLGLYVEGRPIPNSAVPVSLPIRFLPSISGRLHCSGLRLGEAEEGLQRPPMRVDAGIWGDRLRYWPTWTGAERP